MNLFSLCSLIDIFEYLNICLPFFIRPIILKHYEIPYHSVGNVEQFSRTFFGPLKEVDKLIASLKIEVGHWLLDLLLGLGTNCTDTVYGNDLH
jgi:hypothetical protein